MNGSFVFSLAILQLTGTLYHSLEDLRKWEGRGRHAAEIVRREVIEKQRRALVIYGDGHLFRVPMTETVVSLLERSATNRVFTIASPISMPAAADLQTLQTDVSSWPVPALAILRGTVLGAADFSFYYPPPKMIRDGKPVVAPVPISGARCGWKTSSTRFSISGRRRVSRWFKCRPRCALTAATWRCGCAAWL